jgi:RND superfamily putative drug exporter
MPPAHVDAGGRGTAAKGGLRRLGEWCARHFVVVIVSWLVALVALQIVDRSAGGDYSDDFSLPGVQSEEGLDVLQQHDPEAGGYSSQIVLHDPDTPPPGRVRRPARGTGPARPRRPGE